MGYSNDPEYREFVQWRARKQMEEHAEKVKRQKEQEQQARKDDFIRAQRIDAALMDGIIKGQTWGQFVGTTGAPSDLRERYLQLEAQHRQEPPQDAFKQGFYACDK